MNNFGLGIILSFTDKASAGINGAVISLNGLNNAVDNSSDKMSTMGKSLSALSSLGMGMTAAITAPIAGFVGKITSYGMARASFIEDTHLAFTSLMSDAQKASDYMQEMLDFAKTTPYAYEGIASAAQTLISTGVKDLDILRKESDGTFSGILQAIGDAAGATGTGMAGFQSMAQALSNIKAEGKASGIRIQQLQRYGIQASKIIGNMYNLKEPEALAKIKSMDADQFIADLTKGIEEGTNGLNGATGKMAGQMENLKSTFTGAKDTFTAALKTAGLELMGGYEDEFGVMRYKFEQNMSKSLVRMAESIKNIAPLFQPIVNFVEKVAVVGSKAIKGFTAVFSKLPKPVKELLGLTTTFLTLAGPGMLFLGKVMGPAIIGMHQLKDALHLTNFPLKQFTISAGLTYLAWKSDFMGLRTLVTSFAQHLSDSFGKGKEIANSDIDTMTTSIANLRAKGDFWSDMTIGFAKLHVIGKALAELFHSKDGLTMSEETWQKAKELGVLPFIEGILDVKYRFDNFVKGFKKGWDEVKQGVIDFFNGISKAAKGTFLEDIIDGLGKFLKLLGSGDPKVWQKVGQWVGRLTPILLGFAGAMKLIKTVTKPFEGLGSLVPKIFEKDPSKDMTTVGTMQDKFSGLGKLGVNLLKFGAGLTVVALGLALITQSAIALTQSGGASIAVFFGMIAAIGLLAFVFSKIGTQLVAATPGMLAFAATVAIVSASLSILALAFSVLVDKLTPFVEVLGNAIMGIIDHISMLISVLGPQIVNIINALGTQIVNYVNAIGTQISTIIMTIGMAISMIVTSIAYGISSIISSIGNAIVGVVSAIGSAIATVLNGVATVISSVAEGIATVLTAIGDNFVKMGEAISTACDGISNVVTAVGDAISGVLDSVAGIFDSIGNAALNAGTGFEKVASGVKTLVDLPLGDTVGTLTSVASALKKIGSQGPELAQAGSGISNIKSGISIISSSVTRAVSSVSTLISKLNSLTSAFNRFNAGLRTGGVTTMGTALQTFSNKLSSVNSSMKSKLESMVSTAKSQLSKLQSTFSGTTLKLAQNHIAVPHFSMSGKFNAKEGTTPSVSVSWYQRGGVFDNPSLIGVGENGREAVMPLEKNTGWITELANKIGYVISKNNVLPTAISYLASKVQDAGSSTSEVVVGSPIVNNNESIPNIVSTPVSSGTSQTVNSSKGNTNIDNSVTFASGSIILNVRNASEEEAERLANSIMEKISWKQKLETMRNYADLGNEVPVFDI